MTKKRKKRITAASIIEQGFYRLFWFVIAIFTTVFLLFAGIQWFVTSQLSQHPFSGWIGFLLGSGLILAAAATIIYFILENKRRTSKFAKIAMHQEMHKLRLAGKRAKSLQEMASTLRATLSFDRVMEVALEVNSLALEEMGVPVESMVGTVLLFDEKDQLTPVATSSFSGRDVERVTPGDAGIIGSSLETTLPVVTSKPGQDPELSKYMAFQHCQTAVCIPLRAGYQIFGAMVLGSEVGLNFKEEHLDLFTSVADQAVIALQNAQLYQDLGEEKKRLLAADEEARKELARNLHDGPTQSIAAIAMHINFIRSLMVKDPRHALAELNKVESLAKDTSKEIRSMLFALRPLILETDGLGAALETMMAKFRESDNLNINLIGGENGKLLNPKAQGVVFAIIEEAVGNCRKYSQAKLIEVRLWQEGDLFVARVEDDGVGFDVAAVNANYSSRGSLGMINMKERSERIDGSIRIDSEPGDGTSVTLIVPLDKQGSEISNASTNL